MAKHHIKIIFDQSQQGAACSYLNLTEFDKSDDCIFHTFLDDLMKSDRFLK